MDWQKIWKEVEGKFGGSVMGIHGRPHWRQVEKNGVMLAERNKLSADDIVIVRLFAVLHDSQRWTDGWDMGHGRRAAFYAREQHGKLFVIPPEQLEVLAAACASHELGNVSEDAVIGTCWDADRLDLVRIGAMPKRELMSTAAGKALSIE